MVRKRLLFNLGDSSSCHTAAATVTHGQSQGFLSSSFNHLESYEVQSFYVKYKLPNNQVTGGRKGGLHAELLEPVSMYWINLSDMGRGSKGGAPGASGDISTLCVVNYPGMPAHYYGVPAVNWLHPIPFTGGFSSSYLVHHGNTLQSCALLVGIRYQVLIFQNIKCSFFMYL